MLNVPISPGIINAHNEFIMPSSRTVRKNGIIGALKIMVMIMPSMIGLRIRNSLRANGNAVNTENNMLNSVPTTVMYTVTPKELHNPLFLKMCTHDAHVNSTGSKNTCLESAAIGELSETANK
ncbi:hypothetical protein D3C73_1036180 [compost metagenome]